MYRLCAKGMTARKISRFRAAWGDDHYEAMQRRAPATTETTPVQGKPPLASPDQDPDAIYNALRATGLDVAKTLKVIVVHDPAMAMRLLDEKWDDLMRERVCYRVVSS